MGKIILFEDVEFGGKKLELETSVSDLNVHGFNDIVSSIIVESGTWFVFDDEGFSGPSYKLTPGKYPNPGSWGGNDDELSSVKQQ
uniref:Beta/gamma-crystallin n=2 Tax=Ciona intestinalis TaxID=7719 RepID=CRYBG_CIOIN|nr:gamma-crystallin S [Ciona intestinalis]|eukprot:XP_002126888.1 gamma-crystallin S [Ciona intestinalis]